MKIHVGSKNQTKITAVVETLQLYPNLFPHPEIIGIDVQVPEFGHPKTLKETVEGAIKRAKMAFTDCAYGFGIEGGLMEIPICREQKSLFCTRKKSLFPTIYMEVGACAIYDGKKIYLGLGPGYEWPHGVTDLILSGKADGSQAFKQLGYTKHEKLGAEKGGIIGFLTEGRVTREDFTKYSIIMALIHLEKPDFYS